MGEDLRDYEEKWSGLPIKYLILSCDEFIVFIDNDNDIDWQTSDAFDEAEKKLSLEDKKEYNRIFNELASV